MTTKIQMQYKIVDLLNDYLGVQEARMPHTFDLDDHVEDLLALLDLPKQLCQSDAYNDNPLEAWKYWCQGFRAGTVKDLEPGFEVLYKATDIFQLNTVGDFKVSIVDWIRTDEDAPWALHVQLRAEVDPTYVEDGDEIWYKPKEKHGN